MFQRESLPYFWSVNAKVSIFIIQIGTIFSTFPALFNSTPRINLSKNFHYRISKRWAHYHLAFIKIMQHLNLDIIFQNETNENWKLIEWTTKLFIFCWFSRGNYLIASKIELLIYLSGFQHLHANRIKIVMF